MMENISIVQQIRKNFIAILSLLVAITALSYNTWRNEHTEKNRNIRVAAFEILKSLGELQLVVDYAHFRKDHNHGDPTIGWGKVLFIKDLAQLVPSPIPEATERLQATWRDNWEKLETDNQSVQQISEEIFRVREEIVKVLMALQ